MNNAIKFAVIGSGSWGTALGVLLARNKYSVNLWGHNKGQLELLKKDRENSKYLPGINFPERLSVVTTLEKAMKGASIVVMAIPSHAFRAIFCRVAPLLESNSRIISATKGIENDTLCTMSQVMLDKSCLKKKKERKIEIGVLSGPSFAKEVALCIPTAVTIAFDNIHSAQEVQKLFGNEYFRVYSSRDIIGLEISAALKNVIAIAAGVSDGLGYGLNTRAALITRGLAEIRRLGRSCLAEESTFSGLSGLGDLILTCTGDLSRNRMVGLQLGKGHKIDQIVKDMCMVAEGVKTAKSVHDLASKLNIEMPISEQIYQIIYNNKSCSSAVNDLLKRDLKSE